MYNVELYARVRRACMVEGMSVREASRVFGLHRDTVRKMLAYSVPPGYRRQDPPRRPKLAPFTGVIEAILEADRQVPRKQRHTAKRIFERLRGEHGFDGGYTTVKDYVMPGTSSKGGSTPTRWQRLRRSKALMTPGERTATKERLPGCNRVMGDW